MGPGLGFRVRARVRVNVRIRVGIRDRIRVGIGDRLQRTVVILVGPLGEGREQQPVRVVPVGGVLRRRPHVRRPPMPAGCPRVTHQG